MEVPVLTLTPPARTASFVLSEAVISRSPRAFRTLPSMVAALVSALDLSTAKAPLMVALLPLPVTLPASAWAPRVPR